MDKPIALFFETVVYIVLMLICASYTVIAYKQNYMSICYANAGTTLVAFVMAVVRCVSFVKSIITGRKGSRYK